MRRRGFPQGHPNLQKRNPLRIGRTPREYGAEAGDHVTMKLFETLMADEEGHIDFLETRIHLFDRLGA